MTKADSIQDRLPSFEGTDVGTQRLKFSGAIDKDKWIADHNGGDDIVFVVVKVRVDNVGHKFVEDGVIRVEAFKVIDAVVDKTGTLEKVYAEHASAEIDLRRERSGEPSLDDAVDEQNAKQAADAARVAAGDDSGDEVAKQRASKATGATKKVAAPKKAARKATGADKRSRRGDNAPK